MERFKDLANQIWTTRVSRVNAEKRLINKETFSQVINIYYSCFTIIFSILSLVHKDEKLSMMTIFMTISLLIVILFLKNQKYLEYAREYRKNYTALQKLEFELEGIEDKDVEDMKKIAIEYCNLMDSSSNHISFDYFETIHGSKGDYHDKNWKNVRVKYYFNQIWRWSIKIVVLVLPIVLYFVCKVL